MGEQAAARNKKEGSPGEGLVYPAAQASKDKRVLVRLKKPEDVP